MNIEDSVDKELIAIFTVLFLLGALNKGPLLFGMAFLGVISLVVIYLTATTDAFTFFKSNAEEETSVDPVTELQNQYAKGNISESEFEKRLDKLVESQKVSENIDTEELEL